MWLENHPPLGFTKRVLLGTGLALVGLYGLRAWVERSIGRKISEAMTYDVGDFVLARPGGMYPEGMYLIVENLGGNVFGQGKYVVLYQDDSTRDQGRVMITGNEIIRRVQVRQSSS